MMLRSLLAASAVLLVALPARAERPNDAATLEYLPSPATVALCPAAEFLALEVHIRLRYALFQPSAPNHLTVKVDRANGRFRSIGEMRDDDGKVIFARTYSEIDCTAALVSMAIGVSIQFTKPPEPPEPSPAEPPPPSPPEPSPPSPPPPQPVAPPGASTPLPERRRFQAGVAAVFSVGTAPTVVGGVGWSVGVRWPSVSVALEGRALFAAAATIKESPVRDGYDFVFVAISGSGCYHPSWLLVCARAEIGNLSFGNTSVEFGPSSMAILGLGVRLGGDWKLTSRLVLRAYADILGQPLSGHLNTISGKQSVWNQAGLSGSVGLGPILTFSGI